MNDTPQHTQNPKANKGALHLTKSEDKATFEDMVKSGQPMLVDFYADWCGPCKLAAPIIEKLGTEYAGKVVVVKLDVDALNDVSAAYGVMSIPTVITFKSGKEVSREIGFVGEAKYRQMLEAVKPD